MQFAKLYVRTLLVASLALAGSACQSARKPTPLLPPANAPALKPANPAAAPAAKKDDAAAPAVPAQAKTEPQPAEIPAPETKPASDAVADLIAKVEKEYEAGLADHQAGNVDLARQDFDRAFNLLLGSNLDIRSDPRLEKEFDRIVEGANRLNLDGLGGDGEAQQQQKSEPAPIDETNEIAPPAADPNVKAKAQAEIKSTHSDLPLMMTDQVAGYISYFSNRGRGVFERAFARSGRYREMMLPILKEEGVPQDLIYLAQAESGFHPLAVSRVGARGIWQFMSSRARGYGLSHSMWVDDRQDPEKSTRAAARHLKDLYNQFGDWYLAMAAYNSGPGTVQAAVKRTGYADFWELYRRNVLPKETRNYVPIILAVTIITKNLSQYGFDDVSMDEPLQFDTVTIDYPVDLRLVAQCVGATQSELQDLNPSLLRLTTPREGSYQLHIPAGTKGQYQSAIAGIPRDMRLWWRYHTVHSGETLASLSRAYRIPVRSIVEANKLDDNELQAESRLIIPLPPSKRSSDTATYARRITRYRVRPGDTVQTVADNFGVSPQMIRRWNGLRGDSLKGRRVVALHLPVSPSARSAEPVASRISKNNKHKAAPGASPSEAVSQPSEAGAPAAETPQPSVVRHKVKSGETLYSIATSYNTTVDALRRDNQIAGVLRPGMVLVIQPRQ